jgi:acetylornithine/N-succinyldiaminopimelate aminotransferase
MNDTRAEKLFQDPRILEGKRILLEALKDHTSHITGIQPPTLNDEKELSAFNHLRGANLYFPLLGSGIGNGTLVELEDGSVKYDLITGIGVHIFGHSHPKVVEASLDAALRDIVMQGNLHQNVESFRLTKMLAEISGLPHCFLTTSGVMANENAVKIAFQKNAPADRILAFERCFAGRSLTFSQVTDKPAFRDGLPINLYVDYIPYFNPDNAEESIRNAQTALLKTIHRYPKSHAIMMFELIQGEAGFWTAPREFFEPLMKICKENHIAVFADEVQTFARTSHFFIYQRLGLEAYIDIAAIGKLTQLAATFFTDEYKPRPLLLSQTFTGSTSSIFTCQAILELLSKGNFYGEKGRMKEIELRFHTHLARMEKQGLVKGSFGLGSMIAFTPLDGSSETATKCVKELFNKGVIGFIAGTNPSRIRFLVPALVITDEDIDASMKIVEETLQKVKNDVSHSTH